MSVTLHTTLGPLKLNLFPSLCPKTCYNFLALCASGYYDNVPIHRIVPGFLFQTGDGVLRTGKHPGRSVYTPALFEDEIRPSLRHGERGMVAMAKGRDKETGEKGNGSQFYVTFQEQKGLDGEATVFGRIVEGWEVLDKLEKLEVDKKGRPKQKVEIERMVIHANPIADGEDGDLA